MAPAKGLSHHPPKLIGIMTSIFCKRFSVKLLIKEHNITANKALEENEVQLAHDIRLVKSKLSKYSEEQGLSEDNLKDASNANDRIAELDEEILTNSIQYEEIKEAFQEFAIEDSLKTNYENTLKAILDGLNAKLNNLNEEVKTIGLEFYFDMDKAKKTFLYEVKRLDESLALRADHLQDVLFDKDLWMAESGKDFIAELDNTKQTQRVLKEYFSQELQFEIFKLIRKKILFNVVAQKQIAVKYY